MVHLTHALIGDGLLCSFTFVRLSNMSFNAESFCYCLSTCNYNEHYYNDAYCKNSKNWDI